MDTKRVLNLLSLSMVDLKNNKFDLESQNTSESHKTKAYHTFGHVGWGKWKVSWRVDAIKRSFVKPPLPDLSIR